MKIIILGLRRSGTTIFWETFRRDRRFLCFDEPFNPWLKYLPEPHPKNNVTEFIKLLEEDPITFWNLYSSIDPIDQMRGGLSDKQLEYLNFLLKKSSLVAIDTTRCHLKIDEIHKLSPKALLIHLHRAPASFATSHLKPLIKKYQNNIFTKFKAKKFFWEIKTGYNNWGLEDIIGNSMISPFALRLQEMGYDYDKIKIILKSSAVTKLLIYWKLHFDKAEEEGRKLFNDNFISINFEEFCQKPKTILSKIYQKIGINIHNADYSYIKQPNGAFDMNNKNWYISADKAGLTLDDEFLFREKSIGK